MAVTDGFYIIKKLKYAEKETLYDYQPLIHCEGFHAMQLSHELSICSSHGQRLK